MDRKEKTHENKKNYLNSMRYLKKDIDGLTWKKLPKYRSSGTMMALGNVGKFVLSDMVERLELVSWRVYWSCKEWRRR